MKMKSLRSLIMISIVIASFLMATVSIAAPAPPLTDLRFYGVTSDGNGYVWEYVYNKQSPDLPLQGNIGVFAIYVEGYEDPYSFKIMNMGVDITSLTYEPIPPDYYVDGNGMMYAKMVYRAFPLDQVSQGSFTVQAKSINYPWNTMYDTLWNVQPLVVQ